MPINFPDTPSVNDIFTAGSLEYLWTGSAWIDNLSSSISYSSVTNKPTEFAPSSHDHVISEITDLTSTAAELNILDGVTATTAELNFVDGVTSGIQSQVDSKQNELTGLTSTVAELNILDGVTATATELNILDGVTATTTELNYVDGVTSDIQTQLDVRVLETNGAVTTAATGSNVVRNITLSTSSPTGGSDGDVWLVYEV
jgi:hypothetical protein